MNTLVITFVTACTALVAALVGPVITMRIGRAQINATVLSANRQKWIDGFRDLVSSFCSQAMVAMFMREKIIDGGRLIFVDDPESLRRIEHMALTLTKLRLMINPTEPDHESLIGLMDSTMSLLRNAPKGADLEDETQAMIDQIVRLTQGVLKREWMRVKQGQ